MAVRRFCLRPHMRKVKTVQKLLGLGGKALFYVTDRGLFIGAWLFEFYSWKKFMMLSHAVTFAYSLKSYIYRYACHKYLYPRLFIDL